MDTIHNKTYQVLTFIRTTIQWRFKKIEDKKFSGRYTWQILPLR